MKKMPVLPGALLLSLAWIATNKGDRELKRMTRQNGRYQVPVFNIFVFLALVLSVSSCRKTEKSGIEMLANQVPDGKYLFFHRGGADEGDIYWINFRPIKDKLWNQISNE